MTGSSFTVSTDTSTDALFRAWGSAISAAIAALGFVQTADTGQINWATVAHPVAGSTAAGYEIWRFNDALQSSAPIFFKLEYGTGNGVPVPAMWYTVGTGSDGAGTITGTALVGVTGVLSARLQSSSASAVLTPAFVGPCYAAGDGSALMLMLWPGVANGLWSILLIERTRDWTGAATADGWIAVNLFTPTSTARCWYASYLAGALVNPNAVANSLWLGNGAGAQAPSVRTCNVNNQVWPYPVPTGMLRNPGPSQYLQFVCAADLAKGSTFALSHYGTSRNWYAVGDSVGSPNSATGTLLNSPIVRLD